MLSMTPTLHALLHCFPFIGPNIPYSTTVYRGPLLHWVPKSRKTMPLFDYAKLTNVVCFLKCFTSHMYNEISYLTAIYGHSFSHALLFIFVCLFVCLFVLLARLASLCCVVGCLCPVPRRHSAAVCNSRTLKWLYGKRDSYCPWMTVLVTS